MLDILSGGQRYWVEGAQVPAQIYSTIIWVDIAKYFSGDEVTWIDNRVFMICDALNEDAAEGHKLLLYSRYFDYDLVHA